MKDLVRDLRLVDEEHYRPGELVDLCEQAADAIEQIKKWEDTFGALDPEQAADAMTQRG